MKKIYFLVLISAISALLLKCKPGNQKIDKALLQGEWYYFTNDSNGYIEIYFKDSLVREYNSRISDLYRIRPYLIKGNEIYHNNTDEQDYFYFSILKIIDDSTLKIRNSKKEKLLLKKFNGNFQDFLFLDSPLNETTYDSIYYTYLATVMNRLQVHAGIPKEKRVDFMEE